MIKKEKLKQTIRDFHLREDFDVRSRTLQPPIDTDKIITLIGVRRCGKTSILYEMINRLSPISCPRSAWARRKKPGNPSIASHV